MICNIKEDIKNELTKIVSDNDTAFFYGSGLAKVFSTPALVSFMENTAYTSVEDLLPEGFSTVGIEFNVKHKKASLPGQRIICKSVITKVDGKKIFFQISAFDEQGEVGTATHIRYIINIEDFMNNLK